MKTSIKNLDIIQLVGFVISAAVSFGLYLSGQDTLSSVILGFVLATLTQMFDVQKRFADSEERLLHATTLSKTLFEDEWLLQHVNQIVTDYQTVKNGWFGLFQRRANDAIVESRDLIHSLAEGRMTTYLRSPYSFGAEEIDKVKKSYKHVAVLGDIGYWRSVYAAKSLNANKNAVQRGVAVTRIFIQKVNTLRAMIDILSKHREAGIQVYIAIPDEIPKELQEDYIIADDIACAQIEASSDGHYKQQRISIEPIEVNRLVRNFEILIQHSRKLEDFISETTN
ncbi:MAG: hypothetical protein HY869_07685 [Chloroflexi bacterium]|nr:hypothetical protein [Chloroflexota bacterium]